MDATSEGAEREAFWGDPWHYAIARMAVAARANGLRPIDGPFGDFSDPDGYISAARRAAMLGCEGKWAIHPSQVELANEVFTPAEHVVSRTRRILEETAPEYWVIENVKGAVKWFVRCGLGRHRKSYGPVFLWGNFPMFQAKVLPWKERLSSTRKAERAKIPLPISTGLLHAIEADRTRQGRSL